LGRGERFLIVTRQWNSGRLARPNAPWLARFFFLVVDSVATRARGALPEKFAEATPVPFLRASTAISPSRAGYGLPVIEHNFARQLVGQVTAICGNAPS